MKEIDYYIRKRILQYTLNFIDVNRSALSDDGDTTYNPEYKEWNQLKDCIERKLKAARINIENLSKKALENE